MSGYLTLVVCKIAEKVAKGIVHYSTEGYFSISVGLDGLLLSTLHAGMSPLNNFSEVL
jgi:hypothetical protein